MKILRWMALLLLFILAVLLARENDAAIELVYQPGLPMGGFEESRSVTIPLFLLVLVTLGLGGILGGGLALFQQASLKLNVRRLEKDKARLTNDVSAVREKLGLVTAQLDDSRHEAAELRTALEQAGLEPADDDAPPGGLENVSQEPQPHDDPSSDAEGAEGEPESDETGEPVPGGPQQGEVAGSGDAEGEDPRERG